MYEYARVAVIRLHVILTGRSAGRYYIWVTLSRDWESSRAQRSSTEGVQVRERLKEVIKKGVIWLIIA